MRVGVFCYNFPHYKTQQGLLNLAVCEARPTVLLAQNYKKLNIPKSTIRVVPRHEYLHHPATMAKALGVNYEVIDHDESGGLVRSLELDVGVVLGARILPREVIESFRLGIVNVHPGLIPQNRGLDNLKWAIHDSLPQAATAHLIDERIDAGRIIAWRIVDVLADDTLIDIHIRLQEVEQELLVRALDRLSSGCDLRSVEEKGKYNRVMDVDQELETMEAFEGYRMTYNQVVFGFLGSLSPEEMP